MNMEKLTKNSINALETAQRKALEYGNQSLTPLHLLYALTEPEEGLIRQLLIGMNINGTAILSDCIKEIEKLPKVSGTNETYASFPKQRARTLQGFS